MLINNNHTMNEYNVLNNHLDSFSEFVKIYNYISVFCNNIRSINTHFDVI
jgi:hypothetical protein